MRTIMEVSIVSQIIRYGPQHWRLNADASWSVLAFGSFGPEDRGLRREGDDVVEREDGTRTLDVAQAPQVRAGRSGCDG